MLEAFADKIPALIGAFVAIQFVGASYFLLTLDRARPTSLAKDDTQAGLKIVLYGLILAGIVTASGGLDQLLTYMLAGFKGGSAPIKMALPSIIVGALVVLIVAKALLPRTNAATAHQPERYLAGFLGVGFGVFAIGSVNGLLTGLFADMPWAYNAGNLAGIVVYGAIMVFAIRRFGSLSGWTTPAPAAPPPPQQSQGYPPQGGGYPPQGGGYPPQGGGYPPQGGGYPPQGGGYPPQGGGYPPQGGYGR
jgi:hypothetical protein